jgi:hypothetical protein
MKPVDGEAEAGHDQEEARDEDVKHGDARDRPGFFQPLKRRP